jgi:hypothetical protein
LAKRFVEKNDDDIKLSVEEVDYVLQYADALNGVGMYGNAITPYLINQRLKDVSLNQIQATETSLTNAINNIKNSETVIQAFSQDFEIQSQSYRRLIDYLGDMLAFDWTYVCTNATKESDYKSAKYRKDLDIVKDFFDRFDIKQEFGAIVKQLIRNEAYFGCPRSDGNKIVLQELPSSPDYTMITGYWSYGILFSLNMQWFAQGGVSLDMYPDFFKQKASELFGDKNYKPSLNPLSRGASSWASWQDIPPDVGWCFKMNPKLATRVPYFTGLFLDLIQQPLMRQLQKSSNMASAMKLLFGESLILKDASTKARDQLAVTPDKLGKFLAIVKSAVGESIKVATAPLQNTQAIDFKHEEKLYSTFMKTATAISGMNSSLFYNSDVKLNAIETQLSLNTDEMIMTTSMYPQFESFLNFNVNRLTKNYKFKFLLEGTSFFTDKQIRQEAQTALMDKGIVLHQKVAAAHGMNPFDFERQLMETRALGFVDNLTPIVSGFQMGKDSATNGRPQKKMNDLKDSGVQTREDGGNVEKNNS